MIEYFLKRILSFTVTMMTLFIPEQKYQKSLDQLPEISEQLKGRKFQEWEFKKVISEKTGETHTFFELLSRDTSLPVLLCLPGINTDGTIFFNLKSLKDKYRIIAFNFPDRTKLYKGNIRDFDVVLNDFCETVSIDTITLLGYSIGGGIALSYAANTMDVNIKRLVLVSTTVFGTTSELQREIRGMADRFLRYPDYKLHYLMLKGSEMLRNVESTKKNGNEPETFSLKHIKWYKEVLKSFYWYEGTEDAPFIKCPITVIHGENDRLMNKKEIKATKAIFPQADMHLLPEAGHPLIYTHAEIVDSILRIK